MHFNKMQVVFHPVGYSELHLATVKQKLNRNEA